MKKLLFISLLFLPCFSFGQNLVPNPSFELYNSCPWDVSEMYRVDDWSSFGNSSDYFHTCATSQYVNVPDNIAGHQYPASGNAYCGFITSAVAPGPPNYREFIGTQLISSLSKSIQYFVSFKISRGYSDPSWLWGASDKTGALFTMTSYDSISIAPLNNFAHIYTDSIITDTTNWTRISGSFVADTTYEYVAIGNFFDDNNTDTINGSYYGVYYFIDDVCVSTDSAFCANYVGVMEEPNQQSFKIYPNPTTGKFRVQGATAEIQLFDLFGRLVLRTNEPEIDMSRVPKGIYFVRVGEVVKKVILQ